MLTIGLGWPVIARGPRSGVVEPGETIAEYTGDEPDDRGAARTAP